MIGWDQDVISRAAARCSRLFGEDMEFVILDDEVSEEVRNDGATYNTDTDSASELHGGAHVDGFLKLVRKQARRKKKVKMSSETRGAAVVETGSSSGEESEDELSEKSNTEASSKDANEE